MNLQRATALVTGAARRVGRQIAIELAHAGCNILIHYRRSRAEAESLAREIERAGSRCQLHMADLADPTAWPVLVDRAVEEFGSLDILINNASIFEPTSLAEFDLENWDRIFRINVTAPAALAHSARPHLAKTGCGKIINLTDIAADRPWAGHLAYCATKAAVDNLTRSLAKTLAPDVQVNAIAPGIAIFPDHYDEALKAKLVAEVPLLRAGTPQDIARAVRFLCEEGDYITGQTLRIDGGRSIT